LLLQAVTNKAATAARISGTREDILFLARRGFGGSTGEVALVYSRPPPISTETGTSKLAVGIQEVDDLHSKRAEPTIERMQHISRDPGRALDISRGRLILEVPGYFASAMEFLVPTQVSRRSCAC
jgi:hypothetical protein